MAFFGKPMYPSHFAKAAALMEILIRNQAFIAANKRTGQRAGAWEFFPFILFFGWMIPILLIPALGLAAGGVVGVLEARSRGPLDRERKEKELLEALARHGEITPARAALETTLSVSEAERMLSELAKDGHIEVRAGEGRLGYALWERNRRELEV